MTTLIAALLLSMAAPFSMQDPGADELEAVQRRFVGNYELVKYQVFRPGGEALDLDYVGRIMYDAIGNMAAQGMPRDLPARGADQQRGGFAYFGTYRIDLDEGIVVHRVQGSPTRGSWVGQENVRYFEFADDLLRLSLRNASGRVTATLTWRRLR